MKEDPKHNPHDHLARKVFGRAKEAAGFFQAYLPPSIARRIHAENLHCESGSFIDEKLRGSMADLLYKVEDEEDPFFLYCLLEHQSQPDHWMPFRLLKYMCRIWDHYLQQHPNARQIPPIIPVVLHQGKHGWNTAKTLAELLNIPEGIKEDLQPMLTDFTFNLVDLAAIPFTEIRGTILGRLTMQALKAAAENRMKEYMETSKPLWQDLLQVKTETEIAHVLLRYFFLIDTSIDKREAVNSVKILENSQLEKTAMTLAEQFIEEGLQEGLQKGREERDREIVLRMNASGVDVDQIASLTGIEKADILRHLASAD